MNQRIMPGMALATCLLLASAARADSTVLNVGGTIIPQACVLSIEGGGVLDLGDISFNTLDSQNTVALPARSLPASVSCSTPIRVGMQFTDGTRLADAARDVFHITATADTSQQLGWYEVYLLDGQRDGQPDQLWRGSNMSNRAWANDPDNPMAWVHPVTKGQFDIELRPQLMAASQFTASEENHLTGKMIVELQYL